jgi:hypothetical protein
MQLSEQVAYLFLLTLPIACIVWTITHEELFKEPRDFCVQKSKSCKTILQRKFYYVFTCEYCLSHYITIIFLVITKYHLLYADWRGYLVGGFALVWITNFYMSIFALVRVGMKKEKLGAAIDEMKLKKVEKKVE